MGSVWPVVGLGVERAGGAWVGRHLTVGGQTTCALSCVLVCAAKVAAACMVLCSSNGKIPKDLSWNAGKKMMNDVGSFLSSLKTFDKDNVPVRHRRQGVQAPAAALP